MMSSSRGTPDPFTSLLNIVGDPEGTKERIEQLQKATKANEASYKELATRQAELDALSIALDNREADIEKEHGRVADLKLSLDAREKVLARQEHDQVDTVTKAAAERGAVAKEMGDQQRALDSREAALVERAAELKAREADLDAKLKAVEAQQNKVAAWEVDVSKREAEIDRRVAAFRELVP